MKHIHKALRIFLLIPLVTACGPSDYGEAASGTEKSTSTKTGTKEGLFRTVPFITVRNKTGSSEATKFFGDERDSIRAGYCDLSRTPLESLESIAEKAPFYIPDDIVNLETVRVLPVEDLWRSIEKTKHGRRPVLYTHGYYISFERGCKRASLFQQSLDLTGRFLLFSWPSDGAILNYTRDEADLNWSVAPLGEILTDMVTRFGAGNFDIAAHSLGTRGVFLALIQMARAEHANRPLVNQLVLIAPDIDAGLFRQYLPQILSLARNITIYVSGNDKPLALSRQVHGYPRLGQSGSHLQGLTGVDIVDISELSVRYPSGHLYHLYHDIVINDLVQLLNGDKTASQRTNLKQSGDNFWRLQPGVANQAGDSG